MRLLVIGNYFPPGRGTPQVMQVLAPRFREAGHRVTLASGFMRRSLRLAGMLWAVARHGPRCDLVLIDTFSGPAFTWAYICGRLAHFFRLPYVAVLRGGNLPRWSKGHARPVKEYLQGAAAVVAVSDYLATQLSHFRDDIVVIPNMLSLENYERCPVRPWKPRYLWLRRFHEIYNPEMAVRALALIAAEHAEAFLTMAGPDAGRMEATKALARELKVADWIHFPGKLSKGQIYRLSREHDFFLHTSRIDNQPVTVLEAMALGLPVVGTDIGGMPYLVKDGISGILVPDGDHEAMASACELLLSDPALADSLSREGRKAAEQCSWENVRGKWEKLFAEVASQRTCLRHST